MNKARNHTVYFEIFGKKLKTSILAESTEEAHQKIKDKIIFHKTLVDKSDEFNQAMDILDDCWGALDKKE